MQAIKSAELKPAVVQALKVLKEESPDLTIRLRPIRDQVQTLLQASEHIELNIPRLKPLADALLTAQVVLESIQTRVVDRHLELSQHDGNVWRLSFVTALFGTWWRLTARDPIASAGPCQDFVVAAWCSLSPKASATDADWRSAIQTARSRCKDGEWRVRPVDRTKRQVHQVSAASFDAYVEIGELEKRLGELKRKHNLT